MVLAQPASLPKGAMFVHLRWLAELIRQSKGGERSMTGGLNAGLVSGLDYNCKMPIVLFLAVTECS